LNRVHKGSIKALQFSLHDKINETLRWQTVDVILLNYLLLKTIAEIFFFKAIAFGFRESG